MQAVNHLDTQYLSVWGTAHTCPFIINCPVTCVYVFCFFKPLDAQYFGSLKVYAAN